MDVALLVFLMLLNALFAMSEMALSAARKARLAVMVEAGERGAVSAMDLHEHPTKFLSTVQIGITSIGVLNGIVGDAAFSHPLSRWLMAKFPLMSQAAAEITATAMVVVTITFVMIIFGELVPKRLGQMYPERVAVLVARPMEWLSTATRPFVWLLSACTDATLKLLGIRDAPSRSVTEEEIAASLEEGLDAGVIEAQEHQMVRNVFRLDERQIGSMMIPRAEITWLEQSAPVSETLGQMTENGHSRYPVCRGGLDDVVGVIQAQDLLVPLSRGEMPDLGALMQPPVFVPETLSGMELLEQFRASSAQLVFVVDEYGEVQGMITVRDVLEALPESHKTTHPMTKLGLVASLGRRRRGAASIRRSNGERALMKTVAAHSPTPHIVGVGSTNRPAARLDASSNDSPASDTRPCFAKRATRCTSRLGIGSIRCSTTSNTPSTSARAAM